MKTIFIVIEQAGFSDHFEIIGVFTSKRKAINCAKRLGYNVNNKTEIFVSGMWVLSIHEQEVR